MPYTDRGHAIKRGFQYYWNNKERRAPNQEHTERLKATGKMVGERNVLQQLQDAEAKKKSESDK
jgi:IS5 family transposase